PWRQKGTGRARQGSIRAPHWYHGGIVFGPHPKNYEVAMPKKMRRLALRSALSAQLAEGQIKVLDTLKMDTISTKQLAEKLNRLGFEGKMLLVIGENDVILRKSAKNIPWLIMRVAPSISTYEVLNADYVVFTQDGLNKFQEAQSK
ncbi:MAG TPA: 50S ribosomal protein L4, partial [Armatimonadota bacterium]